MISSHRPVITIITVVFNGAKTLLATIESIVPQLSEEVEYIIIDGCSTDGTQDIIKTYESALAYCLSEPDQGVYDAWNKGLARATGQYISFIGADDILLPGALCMYLTHIKQKPEIEYWSSKVVFGHIEGRIIGQPWSWNRFRSYMTVAHVGSLHRRDLYDRLGTYDATYQIAGDYEFLLRAGASLKAGFINKITAMMGDGGISNKFAAQALIETARAKRERSVKPSVLIKVDYHTAVVKLRIRRLISGLS